MQNSIPKRIWLTKQEWKQLEAKARELFPGDKSPLSIYFKKIANAPILLFIQTNKGYLLNAKAVSN